MKTVKKSKMVKKAAPKEKLPKKVLCPVCLQEVKTQDLLPVASGDKMSFAACRACVGEIRRTMIAHAMVIAHYNTVPQTSAVRILEMLKFNSIAKEVPPASVFANSFMTMFDSAAVAMAPKVADAQPPTTGAAPACPDCVQTSTSDGSVPPEVKCDGSGNPCA